MSMRTAMVLYYKIEKDVTVRRYRVIFMLFPVISVRANTKEGSTC